MWLSTCKADFYRKVNLNQPATSRSALPDMVVPIGGYFFGAGLAFVPAPPPAYLPVEYVPVHSQSAEPSALNFPEQVPEPLMPLYFPVPLRIFHFRETGFVMSVEADPS